MNILFLFLSLVMITGCDQQEKPRQYTQVVDQPTQPEAVMPEQVQAESQEKPENPHTDMAMAPDARANLQKMLAEGQDPHAGMDMPALREDAHDNNASPYSWVLPQGWKQGPNKGMRLASFYLGNDPSAIDCSIVSLPGMAGGLEANLKRWMGQVGIEPSDDNLQKLNESAYDVKTQGGINAKVYDLTALQDRAASKSMIAAILTINDATVFLKMTGSSDRLIQNKDAFFELLKSLSAK